MKNRIVSVRRKGNKFTIPSPGQIVIAKVDKVKRNSAIVTMTNRAGINYTSSFEGMVHISQTSKAYIDSMSDAFNEGDVIKAKVLNINRFPYQLTTIGRKMGVIMAYCRLCGNKLVVRDSKLYCRRCRNEEHRKVSSDYGKFNL